MKLMNNYELFYFYKCLKNEKKNTQVLGKDNNDHFLIKLQDLLIFPSLVYNQFPVIILEHKIILKNYKEILLSLR